MMPEASDYMCAYGNMRDEIKEWVDTNYCPSIKDLKWFLSKWELNEDDDD